MKNIIFLFLFAAISHSAWCQTFTVTNSNASGPGSMNQAILDASNTGQGTIFIDGNSLSLSMNYIPDNIKVNSSSLSNVVMFEGVFVGVRNVSISNVSIYNLSKIGSSYNISINHCITDDRLEIIESGEITIFRCSYDTITVSHSAEYGIVYLEELNLTIVKNIHSRVNIVRCFMYSDSPFDSDYQLAIFADPNRKGSDAYFSIYQCTFLDYKTAILVSNKSEDGLYKNDEFKFGLSITSCNFGDENLKSLQDNSAIDISGEDSTFLWIWGCSFYGHQTAVRYSAAVKNNDISSLLIENSKFGNHINPNVKALEINGLGTRDYFSFRILNTDFLGNDTALVANHKAVKYLNFTNSRFKNNKTPLFFPGITRPESSFSYRPDYRLEGTAPPNAWVRIYSDSGCQKSSTFPIQGNTYLGQTQADATGDWVYDYGQSHNRNDELTVLVTDSAAGTKSYFIESDNFNEPYPTDTLTTLHVQGCKGIVIPNNVGSIVWSTGDSGNSLTPTQSGYYSALQQLTCGAVVHNFWYDKPDSSSLCSVMSGKVMITKTGSCTLVGNETPLANRVIKVGEHYAQTDGLGRYSIALPAGRYKPMLVPDDAFDSLLVCAPDSQTIGINQSKGNLNFSIIPKLKEDTLLHLHRGLEMLRRGNISRFGLIFFNLDNYKFDATVTLQYPQGIKVLSTHPTHDSANRKITDVFKVTPLLKFKPSYILSLDPNLYQGGDTLSFCATATYIHPLYGKQVQQQICVNPVVNAPYDPNDKTLNTSGKGEAGYILHTDSVLSYRIRFQNIGTDTAFNVVVLDTLPTELDPGSFRFIGSTHACEPFMNAQGHLTFLFKNIMLPDSSTNETGSMGALYFEVKLKPGVPPGSVIKNRAGIYFDYEAPVITNYATATLTQIPKSPVIMALQGALCHEGDSVLLKITNHTGASLPVWSSGHSSDSLWVSTAGTYHAVFDSLGFVSDTSFPINVQLSPSPQPEIVQGGMAYDSLYVNHGYQSYQWFFDSETPISSSASVTAVDEGFYGLEVRDEFGCVRVAEDYPFQRLNLQNEEKRLSAKVYPNPAKGRVLFVNPLAEACPATVFDIQGNTVYSFTLQGSQNIDLSQLSTGMYHYRITCTHAVYHGKLMVEK